MKRPRRNHGAAFKAPVAFAAVKGDKTLAELATQFSVHPTQITEWKQHLLARAVDVFGGTDLPGQIRSRVNVRLDRICPSRSVP